MRKNKSNPVFQVTIIVISFLFIFPFSYAQQTVKLGLPLINIVPGGIAKTNFQIYSDRREKLNSEIVKLTEEKRLIGQKIKNLPANDPAEKLRISTAELAVLNPKINELSEKIQIFNTDLEKVVYSDPTLDKLSIITYFTLKKNQKLWDDFQKEMAGEKIKLKQDKARVQQELTKINIKKQKTKMQLKEGVVLSMYTEPDSNKTLEDSLKSPFTGITYKEMISQIDADSGFVIVSFVMPKKANTTKNAASSKDGHVPSEIFSLSSPKAKAELNKLKDKKFNRLIAHSNGATVVECLINDSLINVKELNIIGGEKSLLNGQALQHLLDNGSVKRIVVWIKLNDPAVWITKLNENDIAERTKNFISFKAIYDARDNKMDDAKVQYKWILNNDNLATLNEQDPQFIATYFKEISKEFKSK